MHLFDYINICIHSVVKHPLTMKRGVVQSQLRISDIQSVYPWNGVSDAIIDFYIRLEYT